jgi:UDPglucose 6-dehydrogenase
MRICVIGAGYVGLATGVMFAKLGQEVVCADIDEGRVKSVNAGKLPFHEPPLEKELAKAVKAGKLRATAKTVAAAKDSDAIFICVQTPSLPSGRIDIRPVKAASKSVAKAVISSRDRKLVVMKSTVVPTTTDSVIKPLIERLSGKTAGMGFSLCMNPEFLQEGTALRDSMSPWRIVIGSDDRRSGDELARLYKGIKAPVVRTNIRSAEMIKYASNVFLATKITCANEVANICARLGIDSEPVLAAAGMDPRIGSLFLRPGLGFGGSCLPKDVKALKDKASGVGYRPRLLTALLATNDAQPLEAIRLLEGEIGSLRGKKVAVLGLAFKGGVDDIRETRALPLVTALLAKGARVVAFDPMAMPNFIRIMPTIGYAESAEDCLKGADGCIVQADWPDFRALGKKEYSLMRHAVIVDGRRFLDPRKVTAAGAAYLGVGYGLAGRE